MGREYHSKGVERTDVLAQHIESGYVASLQVKATTTGTSFTLNIKDESCSQVTNECYVLVGLTAVGALPTYYLLPRNHVAAMIYVDHRVWLTKSAKSGKPHQGTPRRAIAAKNISSRKDRWDELLEPTSAVPLDFSEHYQCAFEQGEKLGITPPAASGPDATAKL